LRTQSPAFGRCCRTPGAGACHLFDIRTAFAPAYPRWREIAESTFPSRPVAEIRAKRVTSILPLDGSPASEDAG
jgi:hypothetical protein